MSANRIAALFDIHGNLPALEAVVAEIRQAEVDQIVVGGDVLPGPMPCETLACLLNLDFPVTFILGNGDREVLARMVDTETAWYRAAPEPWREPVRWTAQQLDAGQERLIAGWPATCRVEIRGVGEVFFCHSTPRNDTDIFTRLTPEELLSPLFAGVDASLVVCGHTHMPFDRTIGGVRVVNAGSVGMPFGEPGADWLLVGPDVEFRRTTYDFAKAAGRIRATNYPKAGDFAENHVLHPPSEERMLEIFSRAALE